MEKYEFLKYQPDPIYIVKENQLTIKVNNPLDVIDGYELYMSNKEKGKYNFLSSSTHYMFSNYIIEGDVSYYKVRAYIDLDDERIYSSFSPCEYVDLLSYSKSRDDKINHFFDALKEVSFYLTNEDLDIAIDTLKLASLEAKEHENRRKLEENAEILKRELDLKTKRKQLQIERKQARLRRIEGKRIQKVTSMELPLDYQSAYLESEIKSETTHEALLMSLDNLGMVDIEYIASLTGEDLKTVISNLRGSIYQNPLHWNEIFYKGWESADEYLSGNLYHKYQVAKEANEKYKGYFENNIVALEGIMQDNLPNEDIYVTLGSPWIPSDVIDSFILYMVFNGNLNSNEAQHYVNTMASEEFLTRHDEYLGRWEIPHKNRFKSSSFHGFFNEVNYKIYGTDRMDMLSILEHTLNMSTIEIYDVIEPIKKTRVINHVETIKAIEKQKHMVDTFKKWVFEDEDRKNRLVSAYMRKYGHNRIRKFVGDHLLLPGLNENIKLKEHQKNAIARIISTTNTLLAHDVGAGKTFTMICAGMELRRLKKSKKNLYVVPNSIIHQWVDTFKNLYKDANLLVVSNKNFTPKKRMKTLNQIKEEDFDAIIMSYSCFDLLSPSKQFYKTLYLERKEQLEGAKKTFANSSSIESRLRKINKTLENLQESYNKTPLLIPFDDLGINTLFLDEAHNYKNIDLDTRINRVKGINKTGSSKCNLMLDKVHCVQRMNNGGRVIFATATPITNSISDIFVIQKYLQDGELFYQNINTFDAWVGMFVEKTTDLEINVDTNGFHLVTRFAKYCNIPELSTTLSSITDFYHIDKKDNVPSLGGYIDSVLNGSENFSSYLKEISIRADDIHKKRVNIKQDNMLKLTTDGRKAALDMRLIDVSFGLDEDAKVVKCALNVFNLYEQYPNKTQMIFCDSSTPKESFNLYDELKDLLVKLGIDSNKIAFIHDSTTDEKRQITFNKMINNELSILIGSTFKMGHGVNVQKHLIAIHHLDVPWRPSDMVQREGRIIRQGNENKEVYIFRYITKSSFDAYSWQLLETKQRLISQIMSGEQCSREGEEVNDTVLNYAEVKALAIGNPIIKKRVELLNELSRLYILQKQYIDEQSRKKILVSSLPLKIRDIKEKILNCEKDYEQYLSNKNKANVSAEKNKEIKELIYDLVSKNQNNPKELEIMNYLGFKLVIPPYMIPRAVKNKADKVLPYLHVVNNNTYILEISTKNGILQKLNNLFEGLPKRKDEYISMLKSYENSLNLAEAQLNKKDDYSSQIERTKEELNYVNQMLGMEDEK